MIGRVQRIAIHEAGHCVVARKLGLPGCGGVTIIEPHAFAVFSENHGAESVVALMAGAAAEVVAFGSHDEIGIRGDAEKVGQQLKLLGCTDCVPLWHRALNLARRHRVLITRVAIKLRRAGGVLDGAALDRLVWRG